MLGFRRKSGLPYDMFDHLHTAAEARRARRMESIYHVGQNRIWNGREVLEDLVKKHGKPRVTDAQRRGLARVFSIIMWGELAAWKISAQLADALEPLEAKLAASSQVHDEARHFYVMHDYLEALGEHPERMDFFARRVVELTLGTPNLCKKLLGMQLTIETIALTIFQCVRELEVEPVLSELLTYYERDEARHVGLGIQIVPTLIGKMSLAERAEIGLFQLNLLFSTLLSLKSMEKDLLSIGVDPRQILAIGFRKHDEIHKMIRAEFPAWPEDPPVARAFEGLCELLFPTEGHDADVPLPTRLAHATQVWRRKRASVMEVWQTGGSRASAR
jgi:hypothetical protein